MKAQFEARIAELGSHLEKVIAEYNATLGRKSEAEHMLSIILAGESTGAVEGELIEEKEQVMKGMDKKRETKKPKKDKGPMKKDCM